MAAPHLGRGPRQRSSYCTAQAPRRFWRRSPTAAQDACGAAPPRLRPFGIATAAPSATRARCPASVPQGSTANRAPRAGATCAVTLHAGGAEPAAAFPEATGRQNVRRASRRRLCPRSLGQRCCVQAGQAQPLVGGQPQGFSKARRVRPPARTWTNFNPSTSCVSAQLALTGAGAAEAASAACQSPLSVCSERLASSTTACHERRGVAPRRPARAARAARARTAYDADSSPEGSGVDRTHASASLPCTTSAALATPWAYVAALQLLWQRLCGPAQRCQRPGGGRDAVTRERYSTLLLPAVVAAVCEPCGGYASRWRFGS